MVSRHRSGNLTVSAPGNTAPVNVVLPDQLAGLVRSLQSNEYTVDALYVQGPTLLSIALFRALTVIVSFIPLFWSLYTIYIVLQLFAHRLPPPSSYAAKPHQAGGRQST
jgi:hypothetical protein